jgi:hypothetical protein
LALLASGCLWLPEIIPDKTDPPTPVDDDTLIAFCTPRPRGDERVLVGGPEEIRDIRCRIRGARTITWALVGREDTDLEDREIVLATGTELISLFRPGLPWSPRPYEIDLVLTVDSVDQGTQFQVWPLIVVPHADELVDDVGLLTPPPVEVGG